MAMKADDRPRDGPSRELDTSVVASDGEWEYTTCALCGADDFAPLISAPDWLHGAEGVFRVVRCAACGHMYLNPRPSRYAIDQYYPPWYGPHRSGPSGGINPPARHEIGRRAWYLSGFVRAVPGLRRLYYWLTTSDSEFVPSLGDGARRALDLGCADGRFLEQLRQRGWQVQGVEPIEPAARLAQARQLNVHCGTLESARFPSASFDIVFAWMVIEHLHDPVATLREVHRILAPGGWLVFSVPNAACWERRLFGRYWYAWSLPVHLQHFTRDSIERLLGLSEFRVERIIGQRHALTLAGSLGILLRFLWPRWRLGERLIDFAGDPSPWGLALLSPVAKIMAAIGQSSCLTIVARRTKDTESTAAVSQ